MEAFEEFGAYNTFIVGGSHNFFNIGMVEIISALIENEIIILTNLCSHLCSQFGGRQGGAAASI